MSTKLEDWHYFYTFTEKALPRFSRSFFAEEALDGLLHRNTSSTTHLLLDLGRTWWTATHLFPLLQAFVYLEIIQTESIQEILFWNNSPQKEGKAGDSWALVQTGYTGRGLPRCNLARLGRGSTNMAYNDESQNLPFSKIGLCCLRREILGKYGWTKKIKNQCFLPSVHHTNWISTAQKSCWNF